MSAKQAARQSGCAQEPLRYLTQIGLWGDEESWLRRGAPSLALAQAIYGVLIQLINVAQTWGNLELATEFCVALLQTILSLIKTGCLIANAGAIQEVVTDLNVLRNSHTRTGDVNEILRRTRIGSDKFARVLKTVLSPVIVLSLAFLILDNYSNRVIPFRLWYPYDIKPSPMFEITVLCFLCLTSFDYYFILLFDLLVLCLLIEVIGEFRVLRHRLMTIVVPFNTVTDLRPRGRLVFNEFVKVPINQYKKIAGKVPTTPSKEQPQRIDGDSPEQRLSACVVHHQALIKLVAKIEATFQPAFVVHFLCNFSVGLTFAFVMLKSDVLDMKMVSMISLGLVCIGEFAIYCHFCTQLTSESSLVGEALYACPWWNASAGFKSSMRIVQLRTNRPLIIRAAAIFTMSMKTFTKVMNTAYKIYGMLFTTN